MNSSPEIWTLVAGGRSVLKADLSSLPGTIVGINDAFCHLPRTTFAFSMDRLWTENRWAALCYEADNGKIAGAIIRDAALKGIPNVPGWVTQYEADIHSFKPSIDPKKLNGNNSGLCCLQWTYAQIRLRAMPARVFLCGFDMTGQYWYPNYSWAKSIKQGKLRAWSLEFFPLARAFRDLNVPVYNVSPDSAIDVFKKIEPGEVKDYARRNLSDGVL